MDDQTWKSQRETKTAGSSSSSAGSTVPVSLSSGTLDDRRAQELASFARQRQQAQVNLDTDAMNRIDRTMKNVRAAQETQIKVSAPVDYRKAVELNRLDHELNHLERQKQQAQADLDMDTMNRTDQIMKSIRAAQGKQTLGDRVNDTLSGTLNSYAAGYVNAVGTVSNTFNDPEYYRRQITQLQKKLEDGGYSDGVRFHRLTEEGRKTVQDSIRRLADEAWRLEQADSFTNRTYRLADRLSATGARDIAAAKDGLGTVGQLAVDVGVAGGQMLADAGLGVLTGGSSLVPMAVRSFGGGAQEARHAGADLDQQLLYGLGSAALSVGTEKISNLAAPFKKLYGTGAAETIAGTLVKRFGENGAVQVMQQLSQTAVGRIALSAVGEGCEELAEAFLQPFLKRATYDPSARFDADEAWHDALVGGILGGIGGGVEVMGNVGAEWQKQADSGKKPRMTMEDFTNPESPVWNNVEYDDTGTQAAITQTVHREMVEAGEVVRIPDSTTQQTAESFPDLRGMKKSERNLILRPKIDALRASLKQFLEGLKGTSFEFEVKGSILEARLYNAGIREVLEKLNQNKASVLYHSDEIFQNAKYLYSTPDYAENPNIYRWNYFYSPVQIGDEVVGVRIAVRDMKQTANREPESQIYNWGIKKGSALDGGGPGTKPLSAGVSSTEPIVEGTHLLNFNIIIPLETDSVKFQGTDSPDIAEVYLRELRANLQKNPTPPKPDIAAEIYLWLLYEANLQDGFDQAGNPGNTESEPWGFVN